MTFWIHDLDSFSLTPTIIHSLLNTNRLINDALHLDRLEPVLPVEEDAQLEVETTFFNFTPMIAQDFKLDLQRF